ncbi:MAG: PEGA domain-containing protein [Planctomycetes bacterium]|nr:PEGA domain-containing protein [Planctomycetota bacterium]
MAPRPLLAPLLLLAAGCTYASGDSLVFVTSTPAGASIAVDGEDTGFTTPRALDLGGLFGSDHDITLTLDGYEPETRRVVHRRTGATSRWGDGNDVRVWPNPLHWTLGDWFTPFELHWAYVPGDLHVRLYRMGEAPVRATPQD